MCIINTTKLYEECKKIVIPENTGRRNVSGIDTEYMKKRGYNNSGHKLVDKTKRIIPRGLPCKSITFGLQRIFLKKTCSDCKANKMYPQVYEELKNVAKREFPEFKYNCITLNHNLKCLPHKDSVNNVRQSHSIIFTFGEFNNGELIVEGAKINIKNNPLIFNGQKLEHSTADFTGNRYSAVYYYKYYPKTYKGYKEII